MATNLEQILSQQAQSISALTAELQQTNQLLVQIVEINSALLDSMAEPEYSGDVDLELYLDGSSATNN